MVLGPHHHPGAQAAIHTYGHQEEDAGKHVAGGDDRRQFAHELSERPVVVSCQGDDEEDQKAGEEEVSQSQVEKPN